jgi:hypothetical protein
MSRISTSRQHGIASFAARRDPGRPASASATSTSALVSGGVRRANGVVSPGDLLRERGLPAERAGALKAADVDGDPHPACAEREIGELALVPGVNPGRATPAARARRIACLGSHAKRHQISALLDAVHRDSSELRQKRINAL